jgi:hypothetical protein
MRHRHPSESDRTTDRRRRIRVVVPAVSGVEADADPPRRIEPLVDRPDPVRAMARVRSPSRCVCDLPELAGHIPRNPIRPQNRRRWPKEHRGRSARVVQRVEREPRHRGILRRSPHLWRCEDARPPVDRTECGAELSRRIRRAAELHEAVRRENEVDRVVERSRRGVVVRVEHDDLGCRKLRPVEPLRPVARRPLRRGVRPPDHPPRSGAGECDIDLHRRVRPGGQVHISEGRGPELPRRRRSGRELKRAEPDGPRGPIRAGRAVQRRRSEPLEPGCDRWRYGRHRTSAQV